MNIVSDVLLVFASVAIGYAAVKAALRSPLFALHDVVVVSPLGQVTAAQLEYAVASSMRGNFFTVNLDDARQAFEKLPWVRHAQLRRHWPATIEVRLEEQVAVAYWRGPDSVDTRLVNSFGEVFDAASNAKMPLFSGPSDSAPMMLDWEHKFDDMLKPIGRSVSTLTLSGRHAWQLKLDDGMVIELGRDEPKSPIEDRLRRFVQVWPQARQKLGSGAAVADLRYPAGFAVKPNESANRNRQ